MAWWVAAMGSFEAAALAIPIFLNGWEEELIITDATRWTCFLKSYTV